MSFPKVILMQVSSSSAIPKIVFGTSSLGNIYRVMAEETRDQIIGRVLDVCPGIIAFDSAGKYGAGLALENLGQSLKRFNVPQERVLISNKLGWRRIPLQGDEPTFEPGVWVDLKHDAVQDISYDGILRCWEEGNQFLAGYDAQLLSVHDPDEYLAAADSDQDLEKRWDDIRGAYRALNELREAGKATAIGTGVKDWRIAQQILETCDLDWVMIAGCFTIYDHDQALIEFIESLRRRNVAVINSAVFHGGFLTGGDFFNYRQLNRDETRDAELYDWRDRFWSLCQQFETTPAEAAVAFSVSPPGVVSVALNNSRVKWVDINAHMATVELPQAFWRELKEQQLIRPDYPYLGSSSAGSQ
ncbi:aldo/keto reductase [Stieleria bergensis]